VNKQASSKMPPTFGAESKSRAVSLIDALDTEVGDLQHPAAVDDTVGRLEVAVNFDRTHVQISHSLQNVAAIDALGQQTDHF